MTTIPKTNGTVTFVIKNISSYILTVFGRQLYPNLTLDIMKMNGVSEEDIRKSLLKGDLYYKFKASQLRLISNEIIFNTSDPEFQLFLETIGIFVNNGEELTSINGSNIIDNSISDSKLLGSSKVGQLSSTLGADGLITASSIADGVVGDVAISSSSKLSSVTSPKKRRIRWWGDSITESVSNPNSMAPGFRGEFQRLARLTGDDVLPLGTRKTGWTPATTATLGSLRYGIGSPRNEGISGNKIEDVTARVASAVSSELSRTGVNADIEFVLIGTNNFGLGDTPAQMWAKLNTLVDTIRTNNSTGYIVVCTIPLVPFSAANRTAYNNGINANVVALKDSRVLFLDTCSDFSDAEMGIVAGPAVDGHPNQRGYALIGSRMYDLYRLLFPVSFGKPSPRTYTAYPAASSVSLTETNSQVYWPSNPVTLSTPFTNAIQGNNRFLVAINFVPTTITVSANSRSIFYYSDYSAGRGWKVGATNDDISIYAPGSGGPFATAYNALTLNRRQRLFLHYDDAEGGTITLFGTPAGYPVILAQGACSTPPSWGAGGVNDYIIIGGTSATITAYPGLYDSFELCAGTDVPHLDDLMPYLEASWFEHAPLPGRKAFLPLNEGTVVSATKDAMNGTNMTATVFGAGAGWGSVVNSWDS